MVKRLLVWSLVLALVAAAVPVSAIAGQQARGGQVSGTIKDELDKAGANLTVRLVSGTSTVVATVTTNAKGEYVFANVPPGSYRVEVVDSKGKVLAASSLVRMTAAATPQTGVDIIIPATQGPAGAAGGGFFEGKGGALLAAAAVSAIAGVAATKPSSSPPPNK